MAERVRNAGSQQEDAILGVLATHGRHLTLPETAAHRKQGTMLRIRLLGHFEVTLDGKPAEIDSRPVQALLAYLALNSSAPQPRERLAGILWPDSDHTNALANLRHALWRLRQVIGDECLDVSKTSLQLEPQADWWLDAAQLEKSSGPDVTVDELLQAADLYQGQLLPGFYDEWVLLERDRLDALFQRRTQSLIESMAEAGRWSEVIAQSERWIALGSSPEPAYRALMQAHAALGDAAAMANSYQRCRQALMDDLGVEPSPETEALYSRLAAGDRPAAPKSEPPPPEPEASQPMSNLPASTTPFFGRRAEIDELAEQLLGGSARLVTLTGPGGIGKTRLALEAAVRLQDEFPDGVWFIDLAPIRDPDLVVPAIAAAMGVTERADRSALDTLKQALSDRVVLLLLDNFEHLILASPMVSQILASAPRLKVIVTSRERLRIQAEHDFPLLPLPVPKSTSLNPETLRRIETVLLFEDRARAVDRSFDITPANAADVAQICQRLEGLPLAIELAAARVNLFPPKALLQRLETRLEALTGGRRDAPERQQTLRATLTWSYELLSPDERRLFDRLAIFRRGWALEQAEAVCQPELGMDLFDGLASLLDKSLITRDQANEPRYGMLETLREFALENLEASGESDTIGSRHAHVYADLADSSTEALEGAGTIPWIARLEVEHDNLRAAILWTELGQRDLDLALRLVVAMTRFWVLRGYLEEGYTAATAVLRRAGPDTEPILHAGATLAAARLAYRQNNLDESGRHFAVALDLAHVTGNPLQIAEAEEGIGLVATEVGDYATAPTHFKRAQDLYRQAGDVGGVANASMNLGWAAIRTGTDMPSAELYLAEALEMYEQIGRQSGMGFALSGLGEVYLRQGQVGRAQEFLNRSLEIRRRLGDKWGMAATLGSIAWANILEDDLEQARHVLKESLFIRQEIGDKGGSAWCLEKLAEIADATGGTEDSVRLYGFAHALRESIQSVVDPVDQPAYEERLETLRSSLGAERFDALWESGASASISDLVAFEPT